MVNGGDFSSYWAPLGALFFSHTIAIPLKTAQPQSEIIDIRTIQPGIDKIRESTNFYFRVRRIFNTDDEIDILYENYLNMLKRLEQNSS
jgi:hypothetical protein